LWSPGRDLSPRPLPLRERSKSNSYQGNAFCCSFASTRLSHRGCGSRQNDLLIKFRGRIGEHHRGHAVGISSAPNNTNVTPSTILARVLVKWRFVYSPFVNRFHQMFKTAPALSHTQRIIRRKKEYWSSDVHHADTTIGTTPSSVRAAAVHSLLPEHQ